MPRARKVSEKDALAAAQELFWKQGFSATTIDDLQNAMGLQRGSFYLRYKDKRELYLKVLDHYRETVVERRRRLVREAPTALKGIYLYFDDLITHSLNNAETRGCLNTNTATELGMTDKELSKRLAGGMVGWADFWQEILRKAKSEKEISENVPIESTARLLVALTQGINVVARVHPDLKFLRSIVKSGLSVLEK